MNAVTEEMNNAAALSRRLRRRPHLLSEKIATIVGLKVRILAPGPPSWEFARQLVDDATQH